MKLSIGQVLDMLKPGQIAEFNSKYKTGYIKKLGNTIVYCDKDGNELMEGEDSFKTVVLDKGIMNAEWRILPRKFVPFEKAKEAYEKGKVISLTYNKLTTYYRKEGDRHFYSIDRANWTCSYCLMTWNEILEGQWFIED